jgi:orotidine-5'-phosphate decarboxylase
MPIPDVAAFNRAIVEATSDLVCAYKPNFAFYEALGLEGLRALDATIKAVPSGIPIIADAKRGDIGNTSGAYAKAVFETWGCDAVTVHPYIGWDSIEPFAKYRDKGVLVLCRTSNPGQSDFQQLTAGGAPLYEVVARKVREWDAHGNLGLVVGATHPDELRRVRALCPDQPILIPGVGVQGGDLRAAVLNGVDRHGGKAIINSSRGVIYAGKGSGFAQAARAAAAETRRQMQQALPQQV